jgi:hypothetical protein
MKIDEVLKELAEKKQMLIDVGVKLMGDDFNKSTIFEVERFRNKMLKTDSIDLKDNQKLCRNLFETLKKLNDISKDITKVIELMSLIQIKYTPDTAQSKKNIPNINSTLERF